MIEGDVKEKVKKTFKFERECAFIGCHEMFHPTGGRMYACDYCAMKSHRFQRIRYVARCFKQVLKDLDKDNNKSWYKRFKKVVGELEIIVSDMGKEMKRK